MLGFLTVVMTVGLSLLIAEVVLRFLPVNSGMRTVAVTAQSPVFHFTPNRNYLFSRDWNMALANHGRVNNAGFVNDQNYRKDDDLPLLAAIGDSYIEAAMLRYPDTLQGRLANALAGRLRVYSFGTSGAALSQYLIWARHAVVDYGAQFVLINVVGNDFDESHFKYQTGPGFWRYVPDSAGELHLRLFEYHPTILRELVLASALARYLVFNLKIGALWLDLKTLLFGQPAMAAPRYAGNTDADANASRVRDSLAVINAFFRDLPQYTGLPPSRILFAVDGVRYPDAAAASSGTYFGIMRNAFLEKAISLHYDVIDLDPFFFEHYRRFAERFEFPQDGHWNSIGHGVAFNAVITSRFIERLLPRSPRNSDRSSGD